MQFDTAEDENDGRLVFVYGTLKTGQPNSSRLREYMDKEMSVLGSAITKYPYPLILATEYNVPFMIHEVCYTAKRVCGELIRVSDRALAFLDYIESAPTLYCRGRIEVELERPLRPMDEAQAPQQTEPESPQRMLKTVWCWCYFLAHHNPSLVAPPFYSEYDSASMPLRIDVESLTPQQESRIKLCIARQAQLMQ